MVAVADHRTNPYTPLRAPGPGPVQMINSIGSIRKNACGWLASTRERYGDRVALPLKGQPVALLHHPDDAYHVLVSGASAYTKDTMQYRALSTITGVGLLTSDGDQWRTARGVVQSAFHPERLAQVCGTAAQGAAQMANRLSDGQVKAVEPACLSASMSVIAGTVLGDEVSLAESGPLIESVLHALRAVVQRAQLPVPSWVPTPTNRALKAAHALLDDACERVIAANRRAPDADPGSVVSLLLKAQESGLLTAQDVRNELVTMIIAGHETVAASMTWTLGLLAEHTDVQDRAMAEVDSVLDGRLVTVDDLVNLPYVGAVVAESLRLYPPAWVMSRTAAHDDVGNGFAVPEGTLVIVSPWVMHRREDVFHDPDAFVPDRFMEDLSTRQRRAYVPFGAGKRLCIGRNVALAEQVVMLATMLQRCRVHPPHRDAPLPPLLPEVTVRPMGGMPLRVTSRSDA